MDDRLNFTNFGALNVGPSLSGPSKRSRGPANSIHVPSCLVDGCRSDLSKCREYHRRHKVCEAHSKTPKVTISGREQRFCQQCSRFHSLGEFDEEKRSCRKRLDGHNRRRRKPQPDTLSINSGRFLACYQGTRFSPFHSPQMYPSTAISSALAMAANHDDSHTMFHNAQSHTFSTDATTRKNPFQEPPSHNNNTYSPGKEISFLQSPNCALSLLSSTPTGGGGSKGTYVGHHNWVPTGGPHYHHHHHHQGGLGIVGESLLSSSSTSSSSALVINGDGSENAANNFHCQDMFRIRPDGWSSSASSSGTHHGSHHRTNRVPP